MARFKVYSTYSYDEKLVDDYPCLEDYKLERNVYENQYGRKCVNNYITVDSLEDLLTLMERVENPIIISPDEADDRNLELEIYDGYRE